MHNRTSRRSVLFGAVGAGVAAVTSRIGASESPGRITDLYFENPTSSLSDSVGDRRVNIFSSSHQRFDELMNKHFPALASNGMFQRLKNVCAILHHQAGPAIIAHNVRWTINLTSGPFVTDLSTFVRPKAGKRGQEPTFTSSASQSVSQAGDVSLLSPFFVLRSGSSPDDKAMDWTNLDKPKALQEFLADSFSSIQQVNPSLRSIVFSDHSAIDTDGGKFSLRLQKKRNTERQLSKAVLRKINGGVLDPGLRGAFNRTYNAPRYYSHSRRKTVFNKARKQHARYLHEVLLRQGREALSSIVADKAREPLTKFHRLTATA